MDPLPLFAAGNTASSYAWTGGALIDHNEVGIELDTSAAPTVTGTGWYGPVGWFQEEHSGCGALA